MLSAVTGSNGTSYQSSTSSPFASLIATSTAVWDWEVEFCRIVASRPPFLTDCRASGIASIPTTGISNPNINYINKVLTSWYEEGGRKTAAGEVSGADINRYYELLRAKEEREAAQRREEVYSRLPQIREMDEEESRLGASLSRILVSDRVDKKEAIEQIREEIDEMSAQRAFLMTDNGFELDYMDVKYQCPDCKDTGKLETGERCPCHREITPQKIEALQKTE